jgi:hypothetical protein
MDIWGRAALRGQLIDDGTIPQEVEVDSILSGRMLLTTVPSTIVTGLHGTLSSGIGHANALPGVSQQTVQTVLYQSKVKKYW